jgi:hypothetical protein
MGVCVYAVLEILMLLSCMPLACRLFTLPVWQWCCSMYTYLYIYTRNNIYIYIYIYQQTQLSIIVGFLLYRLRSDFTENTSIAQQWIYVNHTENTASSIVVFTAPVHRNGSYPIVACIFVAMGMCLPNCCQEMGLHVVIPFQPCKSNFILKRTGLRCMYFHLPNHY